MQPFLFEGHFFIYAQIVYNESAENEFSWRHLSNCIKCHRCVSMPSSRWLELEPRATKMLTATETAATGADTKNRKKNKNKILFSF